MRYEDTLTAIQAALATEGVSAFNEREAPRVGLALGSARIGPGETDWRLFVAVQSPSAEVAAQRAVAAAEGHAIVVEFGTVEARISRTWAQQRRDPLEMGQQIKPAGAPWVGTGSLFVGDFQITNEHVTGFGADGTPMEQGGEVYGVVDRTGRLGGGINHYDVAAVRLTGKRKRLSRWSHGLDAEIVGIADVGPADVGRVHVKSGRTTGSTRGTCEVVGMRGFQVAYDHATLRFDGIAGFVSDAGPFSQPGDSGSTIVRADTRVANALLFAGGPGSDGRDWTFACPLAGALRHIGIAPTLT